MQNLEQRKADILAKAHADVFKAEQECLIIESLPIVPDGVHVYALYGAAGSARYNATDLEHALQLFSAFDDILPSYVTRQNRTVSVRAVDDGKSEDVQECFAIVEITKYAQLIKFYVNTPAGVVRVEISMGFCPFGQFAMMDRHRTKHFRWEFRPTNKLGGLLRVAAYAPLSSTGSDSAGHYVYAAFERFEIVEQLSEVN